MSKQVLTLMSNNANVPFHLALIGMIPIIKLGIKLNHILR